FQVVGVFNLEGGNGRREERLYIPYTTYQVVYEPTQKLDLVGMTTQKDVSASELEAQLREILARELKFDPADNQAIDLENNEEDYKQFQGLFTGIAAIVWFVGLGTLAAGIVGVSSIMLIIVKERTKEIGVRKALGATPFSIVSLILQESIFITSFAGYIGMLFGIGVLEILRTLVEQIEASGGEAPYFSRPEMNLGAAVAAIIVLVVAGALAGFFPAMRAANVKPIEALRAD
ncbi:MAG: ABC transporter permease, partial [Bacteroidota bacterium]